VGIFDFFKKGGSAKGGSAPPPAGPVDKRVAGHAKVAADKRAQTYDRIEAIQALVALQSPEAAAALLKRFSFSIDPSITDQEEKELAFQGIVSAGRGLDLPRDAADREKALADLQKRKDDVIDAVVAYCERAEQLTWPLKVLRELLDDEEYGAELVELLERYDTEYARNVEPKVQLIKALEGVVSPEARTQAERFLEDVNETVRFHAVETTFAQGEAASVPALVRLLGAEESVRVKNKVADGLLQRGLVIPAELRQATDESLRDTNGYSVDADGKVVRRGGY
jgi:HEAT repeat protein